MTLEEAKEFILFCKAQKVFVAKFGELEFRVMDDVDPGKVEKPMTDEQLLFMSSGG